MLRWIETAVFLPFMRVHGYMSRTEPWNYSEETQRIYRKQIDMRYKLMPYILSCAEMVSSDDYTMMRPLVFDFPNDTEALRQQTEFMFGPALLVCPVTDPGITSMRVYLPECECGWAQFSADGVNDILYNGGSYIEVPVTADCIPVFRKADRTVILAE